MLILRLETGSSRGRSTPDKIRIFSDLDFSHFGLNQIRFEYTERFDSDLIFCDIA